MTSSQSEVDSSWLAQFSACLQRRDAMDTADLFASDGWLRHFLVFQWDLRTLHGHEKISAYLSSYIQESSLTNFELVSDQYFKPSPGRKEGDIYSGFTFSTPIANGRGSFNLVQTDGEWKASTVFMMLDSLKGNEELGADEDLYEGRFPTWFEAREKQWQCSGKDPEVLISTFYQSPLYSECLSHTRPLTSRCWWKRSASCSEISTNEDIRACYRTKGSCR